VIVADTARVADAIEELEDLDRELPSAADAVAKPAARAAPWLDATRRQYRPSATAVVRRSDRARPA
jgi:hypothetical protein